VKDKSSQSQRHGLKEGTVILFKTQSSVEETVCHQLRCSGQEAIARGPALIRFYPVLSLSTKTPESPKFYL